MSIRLLSQWSFLFTAVLLATSFGCSGGNGDTAPVASIAGSTDVTTTADSNKRIERPVVLTAETGSSPARSPAELKPRVLIKTSHGDITVELDAERAPVTVENFLNSYANRGFYSNTIFHHVVAGSLLAAGGYTADLQEKEVRTPIRCEADNGLSNVRGTLTMARQPDYPHSATSQFMINVADNSSLDYQNDEDGASFGYCVFGKVVSGLDVVDRIAAVPVAPQGDFPAVPVSPVNIISVERID